MELERQVNELKAKCEQTEKRAQEQRQVEEKKHAEEIQFLKRTNQQLKVNKYNRHCTKKLAASCLTSVSYHRCCRHNGRWVSTTGSDGCTLLTTSAVRWQSHYVDSICTLMPKSNKSIWTYYFNIWNQSITTMGHPGEDMNAATESAVPTSV